MVSSKNANIERNTAEKVGATITIPANRIAQTNSVNG